MLTSDQFARLRRLSERLAGIVLHERHREGLGRRLRRLGLDAPATGRLMDGAEAGEAGCQQRLIALLTTKHTAFFRHPHQLDLAVEQLLWAVHRRGWADLWSAAAATGEEPWSLALAVLALFPQVAPPVGILATDIDEHALAVAEAGVYPAAVLSSIPQAMRGSGLLLESGRVSLAAAARALVRFRPLNLIAVDWPVGGPFDVVCCRNVLMYLGEDHRYAILERIAARLAPDGLLLIDPSEHLGRAAHLFGPGAGGVHGLRRRIPAQRGRPRGS